MTIGAYLKNLPGLFTPTRPVPTPMTGLNMTRFRAPKKPYQNRPVFDYHAISVPPRRGTRCLE